MDASSIGSCRSVLVDLYILEPQSSVEKATEPEPSSFGTSSICSQRTRRTPRTHAQTHAQTHAYAESIRRKHMQEARARTHTGTHRSFFSSSQRRTCLLSEDPNSVHAPHLRRPTNRSGCLRRPHSLRRNRCAEPNAVGHVKQRIKRRADRSIRVWPVGSRAYLKPTCPHSCRDWLALFGGHSLASAHLH